MSHSVDYLAVQTFLVRAQLPCGGEHLAGSPKWCGLDDDDPGKIGAVLLSGVQRVLEVEIDEIRARRDAEKAAAVEFAQALDWRRTADRLRQRDEWLRSNDWAKRVSA